MALVGMCRFLVVTLLAVAAVGTNLPDKTGESLRSKAHSGGAPSRMIQILKQPEVDQQLVVCNAYASPSSLDIYHVQKLSHLTGSSPLKYKECREFTLPLAEGDQLDFKADTLDVGTFYATGLPTSSERLLLIPRRRGNQAVGLSFESHAFTDKQNAQIAVVDAYKGKAEDHVKISDEVAEGDTRDPAEEMLKFSSVVAVNPGKYKVSLAAGSSNNQPSSLLVQDQAKCVVMRVGSDATSKGGKQLFPQELVVFPQESGSVRQTLGLGALLLCSLASLLTSFF